MSSSNKTPKVPADWPTVLYLLTKAQGLFRNNGEKLGFP
jgi:hypothetical protein